jgi:hypothetical protein
MKRATHRELTSGRDLTQVPSRNMPGETEEDYDKRHPRRPLYRQGNGQLPGGVPGS